MMQFSYFLHKVETNLTIDQNTPWIQKVQEFGKYSDEKIAEKIKIINHIPEGHNWGISHPFGAHDARNLPWPKQHF